MSCMHGITHIESPLADIFDDCYFSGDVELEITDGAYHLTDHTVPGMSVETNYDEMKRNRSKLAQCNSVEGEGLAEEGIGRVANHPSFHSMALLRQQFQFHVAVHTPSWTDLKEPQLFITESKLEQTNIAGCRFCVIC